MSSSRDHLACLRVILDELRYAMYDAMHEPTTLGEWLQIMTARAAKGWRATAELHLLAVAGDGPAGSQLGIAVADMRDAILQLGRV